MTLWVGPLLPLAALVWPLLIGAAAALPGVRDRAMRLLWLAPLPALWLALAGESAATLAPDLLLGVTLGLDPGRRLLLGMTAALWIVAGLAAQPMAERPRAAIFAGFWCLTLSGNLAVFLAQDVVTFYVAFAAVSLAAWFLVVHERTDAALAAGRVYIVVALAGEVCLLVGLLIGAHAAGATAIAEVRAALGTSPGGPLAVALLTIGFGIKAGLVPLHVWLPLAHPAAPVPASAVLSGAIVKAGLAGMLLFLPEGAAGPALIALGLAGAYGAALWALTQRNPKTVLAYSTVSQMGLILMLVGAGGAAREAAPYVALHHGLAKGALFLLVGAMLAAGSRRQRAACLALAAVAAASVAGAPLSGGALAKAAVKSELPAALAQALSLSSVTTTLALGWFLHRLARTGGAHRSALPLALPAVLTALAFAAPWALWQDWTGRAPVYALAPDALRAALWPVAAGGLGALILLRFPLPEKPPGDLLTLPLRWRRATPRWPELPARAIDAAKLAAALRNAVARGERALLRRQASAALLPLLALALFGLLAGRF
ncbi:NADH/ubiquinone/plastoquinone (complex I) [Rhodosalinus halophilus]|uniref:NADH/ubiquinone/plastoquinone (Complex I) n=1 Tax=Rhodosalinus halophilus TaxID=2259333 RepID=A0A365UB17_9RHOB|nr:complex I subunit 5 family protein [Rhodosalinus halophilus]RBI86410.1 NADH/ubiquinone/plastoquinone (complex I) [Rhodosalinus halophilus]